MTTPEHRAQMKLIDSKTRREVEIGAAVTTSDGETGILKGYRKPHKPASSGFIYVEMTDDNVGDPEGPITHECEWYPFVCGLQFHPRPDRENF